MGMDSPFLPNHTTMAAEENYTFESDHNFSFMDMNFTGGHEDYVNPFDRLDVQVIFILLYGIVFTSSFIGNMLVIIVILKHKKMRSVTNFFLANLAVADLGVGVFCVLPNLGQHLSPYWVLGRVLCKLTYFVQVMSYTASICILTVISIERFFAILYPIKSKQLMTLCLLRVVVIAVWVFATCCGIPNLIFYDTVTIVGTQMTFCMNSSQFNTKAYNITNLVLLYIIPLLLMTVLYTRISMVLWKTSKVPKTTKICFTKRPQFPDEPHQAKVKSTEKCSTYYNNGNQVAGKHATTDDESCMDDEQSHLVHIVPPSPGSQIPRVDSVAEDYEDDWPGNKAQVTKAESQSDLNGLRMHCRNKQKKLITSAKLRLRKMKTSSSQQNPEGALVARRRVIRLLIAVIVSFAVCVLPYHIRVIWFTFVEPQFTFWERLFTPITFVIYYLNSALNPLMYAFLSANFRRSLWQVLKCQDKPSHRNVSMQSYSRTANTTL